MERAINPTEIQAVFIDGACLWGARQLRATITKLSQDRRVAIINRMDLDDPAANSTPVAALLILCRQMGLAPSNCLLVDHDHRRASLASMLGFKSAVTFSRGGHSRMLMAAGLLAEQDLLNMGILPLGCLSELVPLLEVPRRALD